METGNATGDISHIFVLVDSSLSFQNEPLTYLYVDKSTIHFF